MSDDSTRILNLRQEIRNLQRSRDKYNRHNQLLKETVKHMEITLSKYREDRNRVYFLHSPAIEKSLKEWGTCGECGKEWPCPTAKVFLSNW